MKTTIVAIILVFSSLAYGRIFNCATQLPQLKAQAEKCLIKTNPVDRFLCVNPLRNEMQSQDYANCRASVTLYTKDWNSREHKRFPSAQVGIAGNADPLVCRHSIPIWTARMRQCAEFKEDKTRARCADREEKVMLPSQKSCFLSLHRMNAVVARYEEILHPDRQPAMMIDGPVIVLKRAPKVQRVAK